MPARKRKAATRTGAKAGKSTRKKAQGKARKPAARGKAAPRKQMKRSQASAAQRVPTKTGEEE